MRASAPFYFAWLASHPSPPASAWHLVYAIVPTRSALRSGLQDAILEDPLAEAAAVLSLPGRPRHPLPPRGFEDSGGGRWQNLVG
ncbi:hypothetical protein N656DRAFT_415994 [Canariomyces notabilis]|uniref:Uncharacterized protein n=1 Tax=Canariomyces notabilis TaxID=2074819 RepID=A0AAN6T848_9PEZI|nr:hypothetical protein N656DRAFT_415994 [Canariomyces arenarius]